MLCEKCNKNEATIHYTEIINGVKNEHFLCSECASDTNMNYYSGILDGEFPFSQLMNGILSLTRGEDRENEMMHVVCPKCGMNYDEFTRVSKFGCEECYNVFGPLLQESLKKIQGDTKHIGKHPGEAHKDKEQNELEELNQRLKEAIIIEDFEAAASLRDKIRELRRQD